MKQLLVIGGTNFIGRNLLQSLLQLNKYDITLFNRGVTNSNAFPHLKRLKGDRNTDEVEIIGQQKWDYIIDLSGYLPHSLERILKVVNQDLKRYIFISTCSVYDNEKEQSMLRKEDAPILECTKEQANEANLYVHYGNKKAACERLLQASNLDYIILRPALVYGEFDHTDRLYYWLYQVQKYEQILVPDEGKRIFSLTYVKDLVNVILQSLTISTHENIYTVTSHPLISIEKIVTAAIKILNKKIEIVNAPADFLIKNEIKQWSDMPLWLNSDYYTYSNEKLLNDFDISIIGFQTSIKQTINYYRNLNWHQPIYGMSEDQKQTLLSKKRVKNNL